jgi:hypothetical protein
MDAIARMPVGDRAMLMRAASDKKKTMPPEILE